MQYSKEILELFDNPKYYGRLPDKNNVYKAEVSGSLSTNFVRLYLQINKSNIIENVRYLVNGCPVLIACCETTAKLILGKSVGDAKKVSYLEITKHIKIPDLKLYCAIQIEEASYMALTRCLDES